MLFTNVKRKAEEGLSRERIEYRERYQETLSSAEMLLDTRYEAVQLLHECEEYLQMISNHPYTYDLKRSKVYKEYQAFEKQLKKYKPHKSKAESLLGAGKVLGVGRVLLGPNAMLAKSSGVKEEKIIHSTQELDEKFGKRKERGLFNWLLK